jgi:hypothetical protein
VLAQLAMDLFQIDFSFSLESSNSDYFFSYYFVLNQLKVVIKDQNKTGIQGVPLVYKSSWKTAMHQGECGVCLFC